MNYEAAEDCHIKGLFQFLIVLGKMVSRKKEQEAEASSSLLFCSSWEQEARQDRKHHMISQEQENQSWYPDEEKVEDLTTNKNIKGCWGSTLCLCTELPKSSQWEFLHWLKCQYKLQPEVTCLHCNSRDQSKTVKLCIDEMQSQESYVLAASSWLWGAHCSRTYLLHFGWHTHYWAGSEQHTTQKVNQLKKLIYTHNKIKVTNKATVKMWPHKVQEANQNERPLYSVSLTGWLVTHSAS